MATIDELESRLRFVEADMASEKEISRATLQQSVRNGAVLNSLRTEVSAAVTRIDQLAADATVANSTLRHHSTLLAVLQQDVTAFRQDVTALRRGQEELHARLDQTNTRLDQTNARIDAFQADVAARLDRQDSRLEAMERNIAAILAAVAPGGPAPA
jgi:phosphate starvation-inducible protein PhoH